MHTSQYQFRSLWNSTPAALEPLPTTKVPSYYHNIKKKKIIIIIIKKCPPQSTSFLYNKKRATTACNVSLPLCPSPLIHHNYIVHRRVIKSSSNSGQIEKGSSCARFRALCPSHARYRTREPQLRRRRRQQTHTCTSTERERERERGRERGERERDREREREREKIRALAPLCAPSLSARKSLTRSAQGKLAQPSCACIIRHPAISTKK